MLSVTALGLAIVALLLILVLVGMPVGAALLIAGVAGHILVLGFPDTLNLLSLKIYGTLDSFTLVAIPLFVLMGYFASEAKFISPLYNAAKIWFGRVPGSLAISTIAGCGAFGAISGSSSATAVTMGIVAYPEMKSQGYSPRFSASCIAAGGTLGIMIPPSLPLILYGIILEQPIGQLFIATVVPGIIMISLYALTVIVLVKLRPALAPRGTDTYSLKQKIVSLFDIAPVAAVFFVVIGGIYGGVFTPMEASAIGCAATLVLGMSFGQLSISGIRNALRQTAITTGMIFFIILGAVILSDLMILTGLSRVISELVSDLNVPKVVVLCVIAAIFLVLGMLMDVVGLFMITLPVLYPVVLDLGFNPIWFGVVAAILAEACLITPPVGLNVFVLSGIVDCELEEIFKGVLAFLPAILVLLALLIAFPELALYLPSRM